MWIFLDEIITANTFIGGAFLLIAIAGNAITGKRWKPPPFNSPWPKYGARVHFACANDDETRIWDMSEIDDPSRAEGLLGDEEVQKLRVEAGVVVEGQECYPQPTNSKFGRFSMNRYLAALANRIGLMTLC